MKHFFKAYFIYWTYIYFFRRGKRRGKPGKRKWYVLRVIYMVWLYVSVFSGCVIVAQCKVHIHVHVLFITGSTSEAKGGRAIQTLGITGRSSTVTDMDVFTCIYVMYKPCPRGVYAPAVRNLFVIYM